MSSPAGSAGPHSTALTAQRRTAELGAALDGRVVDVLVVGLGVTGAGAALDAASRGMSVVAVDAHDLAFGTSRWSSKLVHGGLRYLAQGQVGVAHESAVERGVLMTRTAPHLTRALPMLLPLVPMVSRTQASVARAGLLAGDGLRTGARTSVEVLPRPRRLGRTETLALAPSLRASGLRGGLLSWDGQLEDDARLVVALARTAAGHGASVLTRTRVLSVEGRPGDLRVTVRDELSEATGVVRARTVVNAAGVWADQLADGLTLRPSRGTHIVLPGERLPGLRVAVMAPVPGERNRFVFALPQPDGQVYVGLTDEPVEGPVPDVPEPTEGEIGFLLDVISAVLDVPLHRDDVAGAYAGLRPLLHAEGRTADLSRRHAVLTAANGMVTVVGGKLTTYRRMGEDAVDAALAAAGLTGPASRTARLPLVGAAARPELARIEAPLRLVRRFGTEAEQVLEDARRATGLDQADLLAPVAPGLTVTRAELLWGATREGALDVDDLLDRRTRVGLVPGDREAAVPAAHEALAAARTVNA